MQSLQEISIEQRRHEKAYVRWQESMLDKNEETNIQDTQEYVFKLLREIGDLKCKLAMSNGILEKLK